MKRIVLHRFDCFTLVMLPMIMLIFTLASCVNDSFSDSSSSDGNTLVTLSLAAPGGLAATRALSNNESTINNVLAAVYDANGELKGYSSITPQSTDKSPYSMSFTTKSGSKLSLYLMANCPSTDLIPLLSSKSAIDAYTLSTLTKATDLADQSQIPMFKSTDIDLSSSPSTYSPTAIVLDRAIAKIGLKLSTSSADVKITSYQLFNVPTGSYLSANNPKTKTFGYKDFDLTATNITKDADCSSVFYMYENSPGAPTTPNTGITTRYQNKPTNATYLVVKAQSTDQSSATTPSWNSTYYIALGGGDGTAAYDDYNIYRKRYYQYNIMITGPNASDIRVDSDVDSKTTEQVDGWKTTTTASFYSPISSGDISKGCYYYSDGTWGPDPAPSDPSKKVLGLVFSTDMSTYAQGRGWTHGYALALCDASSSAEWQNTNSSEFTTSPVPVASNFNISGAYGDQVSNENAFYGTPGNYIQQNSGFPAFYYAHAYVANTSTGVTIPCPSNSSGWFLPSFRLWAQLLQNIPSMALYLTSAFNADITQSTAVTRISAINTAISRASKSSYAGLPTTITNYWTSTMAIDNHSGTYYYPPMCIDLYQNHNTDSYPNAIVADYGGLNQYRRVRSVIAF